VKVEKMKSCSRWRSVKQQNKGKRQELLLEELESGGMARDKSNKIKRSIRNCCQGN
jgi:hypothetical protein